MFLCFWLYSIIIPKQVYKYRNKITKTIKLKIATCIQCCIRFCFPEIKLPLAMWIKNQLLEYWLLEFAMLLITLCCVMIQFSLILSLSALLRNFHLDGITRHHASFTQWERIIYMLSLPHFLLTSLLESRCACGDMKTDVLDHTDGPECKYIFISLVRAYSF